MKAAFYTLGCKVNSYDTQMMTEILKNNGYEIVDHTEKADIYVVNTCAVTNESERKSRQAVRRLKKQNPDAITVFTGCYVQTNFEGARSVDSADIVFGTHARKNIINYINEYLKSKSRIELLEPDTEETDSDGITSYEGRNRAFVKIQDGCNMFCSYCIIPYARGKLKSTSPEKIMEQIRVLSKNGYAECVLTGIHVASYRKEGKSLIDIMEMIDGSGLIKRMRLSSLEPKLLTDSFLKRLSALDSFCDHFHVSLQSGSSRILEKMNRRYTAEEYLEITDRIRKYFPDAGITTDIIAGFPSESEEDFEKSREMIEKAGFSYVHIFPYSPKKGTPACEMSGQLTNAIKHERAAVLKQDMLRMRNSFLKGMTGKEYEVLVERKLGENLYGGYTKNYVYTEIESSEDVRDAILKVKIKGIKDNGHLEGTV